MEQNIVLSGNKLIAEFMGYEYAPFSPKNKFIAGYWRKSYPEEKRRHGSIKAWLHSNQYLCRKHNELRYYNSWDWLMDALKVIETTVKEESLDTNFVIDKYLKPIAEKVLMLDREETFKAVLKFIDYYNQKTNV